MTWIEGFGDEVPIFFVLATIAIVLFMVLAWKSTDVPEPSPPHTPEHAPSATASDLNLGETSQEEDPPDPIDEIFSLNPDLVLSNQVGSSQGREGENIQSDEIIVESGEESVLRRRLQESSVPADTFSIRLKYMDDTQKVVQTTSTTTLGDFRRMHFVSELSAGKVVKLIFNGQVLSDESSPLNRLGLENNCVVHCLVHQARPAVGTASGSGSGSNVNAPFPPRESRFATSHAEGDASGGAASRPPHAGTLPQQSAAEAGIDIGGLLVPLLGVILGLVWYCRIAYAAHFTAAATTALVGLSAICIFSIILVWYPIAQDA